MAGISGQVLEGIAPILDDPLFLLLVGHDARARFVTGECLRVFLQLSRGTGGRGGKERCEGTGRLSGAVKKQKRVPLPFGRKQVAISQERSEFRSHSQMDTAGWFLGSKRRTYCSPPV